MTGRLATSDIDVKFVMRVIQGYGKKGRVMDQSEINKTSGNEATRKDNGVSGEVKDPRIKVGLS